MRLLVATRSGHKLEEIREVLGAAAPLHLIDLHDAGVPPSPEEDGLEVFDTFAANALAKARYFATQTGLAVLADDSGLCVDALDGAPGVRSRRFSGHRGSGEETDRANNLHLLRLLDGVPRPRRGAHYVCSLALVDADGEEMLFEGRCDGTILEHPRGDGGFGYDPLFLVSGHDRTFGEMTSAEKNALSHRADALRAAAAYFRSLHSAA